MSGVEELIDAAGVGYTWSVRRLISGGVDVNGSSNDWTALMRASQRGYQAIVEVLLESGAVVDQADDNGWTAFVHAAVWNQVETVKLVLKNGADVNKVLNDGRTALSIASSYGHTATVAVLLEHNADVNKVDNDGPSSLMVASYWDEESVVRLLLAQANIDTTLRSNGGDKDCLDLAYSEEVKQLIINHRSSKEKQRLITIGLAFASKQLPVHLLVNIYEQAVEFEEYQISLFNCWEILKLKAINRITLDNLFPS